MLRKHLLILFIVLLGLINWAARADGGEGEHIHFKIHVPHHYHKHTHTHTIVKTIHEPPKEHHEEHSEFTADAW